MGKLTEIEDGGLVSPTHVQRLANVTLRHLGAAGVDVSVEAREDGRVSITLPLQWAALFLANLTAQADALKEKLQRATWEIKKREAELQVTLREAHREWEQKEAAVCGRYKKLVARGLSHREALHKLRDSLGEWWTITMLQDAIQKGGARERRQQRAKLAARIQHKAQRLTQKEIAEQEGLTVAQVKHAIGGSKRRE